MDQTEQPKNEAQQALEDRLRYFLMEFKDRIDRYYRANGKHAPLPIYWNAVIGEFCWSNRKTRRNNVRNRRLKNGKPRKTQYRTGFRAI